MRSRAKQDMNVTNIRGNYILNVPRDCCIQLHHKWSKIQLHRTTSEMYKRLLHRTTSCVFQDTTWMLLILLLILLFCCCCCCYCCYCCYCCWYCWLIHLIDSIGWFILYQNIVFSLENMYFRHADHRNIDFSLVLCVFRGFRKPVWCVFRRFRQAVWGTWLAELAGRVGSGWGA